jgi:transcriptional regulator with XRE-family HTH domain
MLSVDRVNQGTVCPNGSEYLYAWCDAVYGRRSELARVAGVSRQAITKWFAGRKQPTAEQILAVQEFIQNQGGSGPRKSRK